MLTKLRWYRLIAVLQLGALFFAYSAASASGAISQSYSTTSTDIAPGTILSLSSGRSSVVQPSTASGDTSSLVGIAATKPLLQLSSIGPSSVQVAVGGTVQTLVSDINGPVAVGDKITASPIRGIGMRAINSGEVVGTSLAALTSVTTVANSFKDLTGKNIQVKIGLLPVSIGVQYYSAGATGTLSAFIPSFIQNLANDISGKAVSPLRVLMCILILLLGGITVTVMLNTAIRTGIISIGRNPLAERALRKGLVDVLLAAMGVLLVTAVVVYAVLTR